MWIFSGSVCVLMIFFISFAIGYYFVGSSKHIRDWLIRLRCVGYLTYKWFRLNEKRHRKQEPRLIRPLFTNLQSYSWWLFMKLVLLIRILTKININTHDPICFWTLFYKIRLSFTALYLNFIVYCIDLNTSICLNLNNCLTIQFNRCFVEFPDINTFFGCDFTNSCCAPRPAVDLQLGNKDLTMQRKLSRERRALGFGGGKRLLMKIMTGSFGLIAHVCSSKRWWGQWTLSLKNALCIVVNMLI